MDHKLTDLIDIERTQRLLEKFLSPESTRNPTGFSDCYKNSSRFAKINRVPKKPETGPVKTSQRVNCLMEFFSEAASPGMIMTGLSRRYSPHSQCRAKIERVPQHRRRICSLSF
ncbi:MAG: hypothetical protein ABSH41_09670 [Syntrophobacteraceae bacterium]|jgi:hypothetical protein